MTKLTDPLIPALLQERSDLYQMLAQAFLTPQSEAHFRAMVDLLADDLAELELDLGYGLDSDVSELRLALSCLADPQDLLQVYSGLFLQPPRPATLNVCFHLDGAMMGGTVSEIEAFYLHYGVERGEHFKDFPDHVSMQLEFVAYLFGRAAKALEADQPDTEAALAARHFLFAFVRRWVPHFVLSLETAGRQLELKANPYLPLARMLALAAEHDAVLNPEWLKPKKQAEIAMEKARADYGSRGVSAEDMADMERKLREKGLSTEHLQIALGQRDAAMGLTAKSPPDPRRK